MSENKKIKAALISVYHKENLLPIIELLDKLCIRIISTGGTAEFIQKAGFEVTTVEKITDYPSIFGGRVKTLHPKIFGGILYRRENENDQNEAQRFEIPDIDLVIVDLYPFEETVASGATQNEIIEQIDIGGISLIRAAAKNFDDVLVVSSQNQYNLLAEILEHENGTTSLEIRKKFATEAFNISSAYDTAIYKFFSDENSDTFKANIPNRKTLRYGENPHQKGFFFGNFDAIFTQIHGKEISYNNLLDIDAALNLISEFTETTFAILKHNNACGLAMDNNLTEAWKKALAGDPVSAYGGILITNKTIDIQTANEINQLFFEVLIAPDYEENALTVLKQKKNRIILLQKKTIAEKHQFRSILNGTLLQEKDLQKETKENLQTVTHKEPTENEIEDLLFANKIVKHSKSNAIVLVKNKQLCASGIGQTSRVDALKQAIEKANSFGFDLKNAVMASDAFFPFADCVEIAHQAGINVVIQPGGSVRDKDSIEFCNQNNMSMVFTGFRHFRH